MAALDLVVFVPIERPDRIAISDDDYPGLRRDVERQRVQQVLRAIGAADGTNEGNR